MARSFTHTLRGDAVTEPRRIRVVATVLLRPAASTTRRAHHWRRLSRLSPAAP